MIYSLLLLIATPYVGARLIKEQVNAYQKVVGTERLTTDGLLRLLKLHDDDTVCINACARYVENLVGKEGMDWSRLEELITTIYGDQISSDPYDPQEVHLSLRDNPDEMKVMWASAANLVDPFVEYTASMESWSEEVTMRSSAVNFTYSVPQNWYPTFAGVIYEADMVGLKTGKTPYRYRVGGTDPESNTVRRSQDFSYVSAPNPDPEQETVFAMLGDQGTFMLLGFSTSNKLIELQDQLGVDVVHYAGDLCYAGLSGDLTPFNNVSQDDEFGHIWDLWGIQSEPTAATRPFMTTPGNHESFYDWTAFTNRYKMPFEKSGGNGNFWFSYDYGNVHVVSVSTEHCFDAGCDQMVWVENDLKVAAANRDIVPWIVLSMHRPMYCSEDGYSIDNQFRVAMEPLMLRYDVDLVVQGHMHAYERVHPVDNGKVTVHPTHREAGEVDVYYAEGHGPVYVVQGNTGAMQFERWQHPKPQWSAIRFANGFIPPTDIHSEQGRSELQGLILDSNYTDTFGLGVADFVNSTHLHYTNIPVSGVIGSDEFWVVKRSKK